MPDKFPTEQTGTVPPINPAHVGMDGFEPSRTTLGRFHGTRKKDDHSKFQDCGFKLPGLFDTQHYERDRGMFLFAMLLEIVGVLALGQVLYSASNLGQGATAAIAIVFVVVDLLLAYAHTAVTASETSRIANNRLRVFPEFRVGGTANRSLKEFYTLARMTLPGWRTGLAVVCSFLIFASAILKSVIFYVHWQEIQFARATDPGAATGGSFGFVLFAVVLLSYLIVALVHYLFTGHFLLGFHQRWEEGRDRSQRDSDADKNYCSADERTEALPDMTEFLNKVSDPFNQHPDFTNLAPTEEPKRQALRDDPAPYVPVTTPSRRHRLLLDPAGRYRLSAYGLMKDDDLIELISAQKNRTAKAAVALYGHHLQLRILEESHARGEAREVAPAGQSR